MEQLLAMKNIPISFEMKIHNAKLEMSSDAPTQQGIVDNDYLTPYKSKLYADSRVFETRAKVERAANTSQSTKENDIFAFMDATTKLAKEGNLFMNTNENSITLGSLAIQHVQPTLQSTIGIPSLPTNFDWDSQQLSAQYETDKKNYDWLSQNKTKLKFTPASVEFVVKEYAHVEITYLGKPQYVPPSASPDYVPPKLDVTA